MYFLQFLSIPLAPTLDVVQDLRIVANAFGIDHLFKIVVAVVKTAGPSEPVELSGYV